MSLTEPGRPTKILVKLFWRKLRLVQQDCSEMIYSINNPQKISRSKDLNTCIINSAINGKKPIPILKFVHHSLQTMSSGPLNEEFINYSNCLNYLSKHFAYNRFTNSEELMH
jgi:hypothetical protein